MSDEQKCVCGHVRGIHSSDGDRPCHYGGLTKETQTCGCKQFIAEEAVAEDPLPTTDIVRRADVAMYDAEPMPTVDGMVGPQVTLLSATPDPLGALAAACKIYKGEVVRSLKDVTDEERRHFWEEMTKTALTAPLEAIDFHFMIEGVTRAFTHQVVRQRTAFFAQESLRFAVKDNMATEVPLPPSIQPGSHEQNLWANTTDDIETAYNALINMGVPAEDARGLLPHATTTRLHYKTNMRGLLQHAGLRLCTQAQFEWRIVFAKIIQAIREYDDAWVSTGNGIPPAENMNWQFEFMANSNQFRPVCYQQGSCQFGADFDRHCSIRDRVEAGEWEKIDPLEWLANHAAARKPE